MKDKASCPVVESIMSYVTGNGKSSLGQASLRSRHANTKLAVLFPYWDNAGYPCWVFDLTDESRLYEFVHLLFDFRYQLNAKASLRLLFGRHTFSNGQAMDSNLRIQPRHLLVAPCKHILIFAKKIEIFLLFFRCQ